MGVRSGWIRIEVFKKKGGSGSSVRVNKNEELEVFVKISGPVGDRGVEGWGLGVGW